MLSREVLVQFWQSHRRVLILLVALLALNLGLYVALEQSLVPQVAAQENLFIKRQAEVRQLLRKQEGVVKTPEHLFVLAQQDLLKFQESVPEYQDFTGLIEELVLLSGRAGLDLTQVSYKSGRVKGSELLHFDLSFNLDGKYEQIKKFIHSLEQSKRLLTISEIALRNTDGGDVGLRIRLETYFRPKRDAA